MELSQRLDLAKLGLDVSSSDSPDPSGASAAGGNDAGISAAGDTLAQLAALLQKVGVVEDATEVGASDTLDSLDVDSLTRIELAVRAEEHFGVRVSEEAASPDSSLGELADFFAEKRDS